MKVTLKLNLKKVKRKKARTAKIKVTKVNNPTEKEIKLEEKEPSDPSIR